MKALVLLGVSACIALSGTAQAENVHAYNGSFCKNKYGSQAADFTYVDGIRNNTGMYRSIVCPVVVDEFGVTSGTTMVWVHFTDLSATGPGTVYCSLISNRANGRLRQVRSAKLTGSGWFRIPDITVDDKWGSYHMTCSLPKTSVLNTIVIGEKN
ncbi:MAG: hypothetical protein HRU20_29010 [Pseudomonadales bacterium]|nr:hypothetical protein [Pseudomonadales bacterium]